MKKVRVSAWGATGERRGERDRKTGSKRVITFPTPERTPFNRGAGEEPKFVFPRGLMAVRIGGVVAAIPCACHTVRGRQRKTLLPEKRLQAPAGHREGTTETLSTEATSG